MYHFTSIHSCALHQDNVTILDGANVTVLPGVTIGSNTIIGAGSVVNKNIRYLRKSRYTFEDDLRFCSDAGYVYPNKMNRNVI